MSESATQFPAWPELRRQIVVWEDESAVVVNKPPGLSVMGERHDTDLITLARAAGEQLQWVNRIDKVTSGAVLLARTKTAHAALTRQFAQRTVDKTYLAICRPGGLPEAGEIDLPLLTAGSGRIRIAAERGAIRRVGDCWRVDPQDLLPKQNYPSQTRFRTLWDSPELSLVRAHPVTGRRHQLRVHLAWIGHAILGDPLFTHKTDPVRPRTYLHSWRVAFDAVGPAGRVEVVAEPAESFWAPLADRLSPVERARLLG
ncbi:RluA family pseudouridine synthase [Granulicoccus phenolivorans]|uniref:RluA family pseudouridine synthase n=1 Tax=Granulicoccus phenolivorans TaxID=266854 RepID=UPI0003F6233F|nr:RNA pseudouridine synthase [Granulicoccus phenolivorans]